MFSQTNSRWNQFLSYFNHQKWNKPSHWNHIQWSFRVKIFYYEFSKKEPMANRNHEITNYEYYHFKYKVISFEILDDNKLPAKKYQKTYMIFLIWKDANIIVSSSDFHRRNNKFEKQGIERRQNRCRSTKMNRPFCKCCCKMLISLAHEMLAFSLPFLHDNNFCTWYKSHDITFRLFVIQTLFTRRWKLHFPNKIIPATRQFCKFNFTNIESLLFSPISFFPRDSSPKGPLGW